MSKLFTHSLLFFRIYVHWLYKSAVTDVNNRLKGKKQSKISCKWRKTHSTETFRGVSTSRTTTCPKRRRKWMPSAHTSFVSSVARSQLRRPISLPNPDRPIRTISIHCSTTYSFPSRLVTISKPSPPPKLHKSSSNSRIPTRHFRLTTPPSAQTESTPSFWGELNHSYRREEMPMTRRVKSWLLCALQ